MDDCTSPSFSPIYLYRFRFNDYRIEADGASLVETIDQWAVQGRRRRARGRNPYYTDDRLS